VHINNIVCHFSEECYSKVQIFLVTSRYYQRFVQTGGFRTPVIKKGEFGMNVYDFTVTTADGEEKTLRDYQGQVMLIVNTASKCGFTPQYKGLQELQNMFSDKGFTVLAFPCNQFGHQEPGTNKEIQDFCKLTYDVTFPVFAKVDVNGDEAHPLFRYLKQAVPGILNSKSIKWNFTKFLIDQNGEVVKRYAPQTTPDSISDDIEKLIGIKS
jgi:glutathione peroxidase